MTQKYKLINNITKEETICDKVVIDGFDYYVGEEKINSSNYEDFNFWFYNPYIKELQISCNPNSCHKVIATNNPNLDIPKVVDEVEMLAYEHCDTVIPKDVTRSLHYSFKCGYNKSQETHSFSEEDMVEFAKWYEEDRDKGTRFNTETGRALTIKELLNIWKSQQPITIYYQ